MGETPVFLFLKVYLYAIYISYRKNIVSEVYHPPDADGIAFPRYRK